MSQFFLDFSHSFLALWTMAGLIALANILFIDIVMSGDNAILIGMATKKLQGKDRKKAIVIGIGLATVLRLIFASMTALLMGIVGIKLAGGFLLLYVVWKFYKELRSTHHEEHEGGLVAKATLAGAIWTIVIADVSMSLDNVLAVAGAAHGNLAALTIGLIVSIVLMAFASTGIAKLLDKYPQIQWLGLVVILFVAVEMILSGSVEVEKNLLHVNIFPFVAFLVGGIFLILQQKYLKPVDKERMKSWITERLPLVLIFSLIFVVITIHFGDIITGYLQAHSVLRWVLSFGLFLAILESISLLKSERIAKK